MLHFEQVNNNWVITVKLSFHLTMSDANAEPFTHLRREIL